MMAEGEDAFRYTSAPERRQRLVVYITEQGYCTIAELSRIFGVSEMTIRRDVSKLVEQGEGRGLVDDVRIRQQSVRSFELVCIAGRGGDYGLGSASGTLVHVSPPSVDFSKVLVPNANAVCGLTNSIPFSLANPLET